MKAKTFRRVALVFNPRHNAWKILWIKFAEFNELNLRHSAETPRGWIAGMPKRGYTHLRQGQFVPAPHKFFDLTTGVL